MAVDINTLADQVMQAATDAIDRLFLKKEAELSALLEKRFSELPKPKDGKDGADGKDAPEADAEEIAKKAALLIPAPKDGRDGEPGKDADVDAIAAKAIDVVVKLLEELPVPKDGKNGEPGVDGKDASPEAIKAEVERVVALISVPIDGRDGRDGKDGMPGRDALHLEIIPEIDQAKVYPRNTFAKHGNGFWRSFEKTDGMKGWECLVAGVASIEMDHDGERGFTFKAILSDGTLSDLIATAPIPLDRGVFKEGIAYAKGDCCTWGGSLWIAQNDTHSKPRDGDDWRLAVKCGRDGKDGEKGERGIAGKDGKDLTTQRF